MKHLPGIINPSDALTKPLSWVLHHRHVRRAMGHYRLDSPVVSAIAPPTLDDGAGEGVGAQTGRGYEPGTESIQDPIDAQDTARMSAQE